MKKYDIKHNKAKCKNCKSVIESVHRHDWVACECFDSSNEDNQGIYIDGGKDYLRRGGNFENFIDLVEYDYEEK